VSHCQRTRRVAKAANESAIFARAHVVGVAIATSDSRARDGRAMHRRLRRGEAPEAELRRWDVVRKRSPVRTDIANGTLSHALEMAQAVDLGRTSGIRPDTGA